MDPDWLSRARIRPARTEEDLAKAEEFLGTPRVREIVEGHPEERGAVRLCEVDDELVAALLLDPTPLRLRQTEIRCARICETSGEDGRSHFRNTGDRELFVLVLEEALGYAWIKRYPIAFVHGELALFPDHGFVPCFYHPRVHVSVKAALALPSPYRVRRLKADDVARLQALRDNDLHWKPVVFSSGVPPFHHFTIESKERQLKGYLSLQTEAGSKWRPPLFAPEIEVADRAAAFTVLKHCALKAQEANLEEMHFPLGPGHPVARLCLELGGRATVRGAATDAFSDEEMVHLIDPSRLVDELAPYFDKRLRRGGARETEAEVPLSTGTGSWNLRISGGRVALETLETPAEDCIQLPHWAFTQLLAGYRAVHELDVELADEQAELLDMLLPKTWPFSMPDPDLWEDLQPPVPYSELAARVVAVTQLPWALDR